LAGTPPWSHIAAIYFRKNKSNLDQNDRGALDFLCRELNRLLEKGYVVEIDAEGGADHRGTEGLNFALGLRRVSEVVKYIRDRTENPNLHILASSIGEDNAAQPSEIKRPSHLRISRDRCVDVFIVHHKQVGTKKEKTKKEKTKNVPVRWIEKTLEYHSGHAGKIVTKARTVIREKYRDVPESWVKYGQEDDRLIGGVLPGGDTWYIKRYTAVYKTPDGLYYSEKAGEIGTRIFNVLTFNLEGNVETLYKSWKKYHPGRRGSDDPLEDYRPKTH